MIGRLRGIIAQIKPTEMILDVQGVGYRLFIPLSAYEAIQAEKGEVSLFVHTYLKEDQLKLFGFHDETSRNLFSMLINISGIGPSIALSILSGISIARLVESVKSENIAYLVKIPGIGKAKAEKLLFELKRKIRKLEEFTGGVTLESTVSNDAIDALVSLGFDEAKSRKAVIEISGSDGDREVESIIKEALRILSA